MSYALFRIPEVQSLMAYIEGIGGDLSGNFLDVPKDELDWHTRPESINLQEQTNHCIRAAFNDFFGIDASLVRNETLEYIEDNIAIELAIQARESLTAIYPKLHKLGYIVSHHSYPVVISAAGDILLEVKHDSI